MISKFTIKILRNLKGLKLHDKDFSTLFKIQKNFTISKGERNDKHYTEQNESESIIKIKNHCLIKIWGVTI